MEKVRPQRWSFNLLMALSVQLAGLVVSALLECLVPAIILIKGKRNDEVRRFSTYIRIAPFKYRIRNNVNHQYGGKKEIKQQTLNK